MVTMIQTRIITVFGIKVAEVRVENDFFNPGRGLERGSRSYTSKPVALESKFITPILAQAVQGISGLMPEKFSFGTEHELEVDGNIDAYVATQRLKQMFGFNESIIVLTGFSALTNAYQREQKGAAIAFTQQIINVLEANWEPQENKN